MTIRIRPPEVAIAGFGQIRDGVLLAVAGAAYVFDTLAHVVVASYDDHASVFLMIVALPAVIAELGFTVWLFARGGRQSTLAT